MKRPRWSHILTRGYTALRKGVSLVTKGIQDWKLGGKLFELGFDLNIHYTLKGIKIIKSKNQYFILGVKAFSEMYNYTFTGIKIMKEFVIYNILGSISFGIDSVCVFIGTKIFKIEKSLNLVGTKLFNFLIREYFIGEVYNNIVFGINIIAEKVKELCISNVILGRKAYQYSLNKIIEGKRDITTILLALDIIGGE